MKLHFELKLTSKLAPLQFFEESLDRAQVDHQVFNRPNSKIAALSRNVSKSCRAYLRNSVILSGIDTTSLLSAGQMTQQQLGGPSPPKKRGRSGREAWRDGGGGQSWRNLKALLAFSRGDTSKKTFQRISFARSRAPLSRYRTRDDGSRAEKVVCEGGEKVKRAKG